jgi:plasmid stabilization system protein ParE
MARVKFTEAAAEDIAEAIRWYDNQAPGLADRLLAETRAAVERLSDNPLQFPVL